MDKTAALASDILLGIGGEKNIQRLENCMTRVRVEVHNDEQLDLTRLKQLPGVSGATAPVDCRSGQSGAGG